MKIELVRQQLADTFTLGEVFIDGVHFCYSVEDKVRPNGEKVHGETAIPAGTYDIAMTMSNRFKVVMPLLLNVKGFDGVRIHAGNTSADTEGCLILGYVKTANGVAQSRVACAKIYDLLEHSSNNQITIV